MPFWVTLGFQAPVGVLHQSLGRLDIVGVQLGMVKLEGFDGPVPHILGGPVVDMALRGIVVCGNLPGLHPPGLEDPVVLILNLVQFRPQRLVVLRRLQRQVFRCGLGPLHIVLVPLLVSGFPFRQGLGRFRCGGRICLPSGVPLSGSLFHHLIEDRLGTLGFLRLHSRRLLPFPSGLLDSLEQRVLWGARHLRLGLPGDLLHRPSSCVLRDGSPSSGSSPGSRGPARKRGTRRRRAPPR